LHSHVALAPDVRGTDNHLARGRTRDGRAGVPPVARTTRRRERRAISGRLRARVYRTADDPHGEAGAGGEPPARLYGAMSSGPSYVLGHSEDELARLIRQAKLVNPITRRYFKRAGVGPGMRVLDLGSGAGDTAILAAELVVPT